MFVVFNEEKGGQRWRVICRLGLFYILNDFSRPSTNGSLVCLGNRTRRLEFLQMKMIFQTEISFWVQFALLRFSSWCFVIESNYRFFIIINRECL